LGRLLIEKSTLPSLLHLAFSYPICLQEGIVSKRAEVLYSVKDITLSISIGL